MSRFCAVLITLLWARTATADECATGTELAAKGDLTRAMLHLDRCEGNDDAAKLARDLKKKLRDGEYAELSVVSDPAGVAFTLDTLPGESITTPATIFLPPGTHVIAYKVGEQTFTKAAQTKAYSRSAIILEAVVKAPGAVKDGKVSFEEENATEQQTGPPPDIKRPSLMKDKYRGVAGPAGEQLEDPLALTAQHGAKPWFGVRIGGGFYDDSATAAQLRPGVGVTARIPLVDRLFLSARLDWSRRGGDAADSVDAAGANVGAGYTVLANRSLALAAIAQVRAELRFADTRDAMTVSRSGVGATAGLELAIGRTPLTAGVRFETGVTELVPGARDRALLFELGVDWR